MPKTTTVLALAAAAAGAAATAWTVRKLSFAMGARPSGARIERLRRSPQFHDGTFHNPVPVTAFPEGSGQQTLQDLLASSGRRRPVAPIPIATGDADRRPATGLHLTWYGHASALVELDGRRVLLDPVWGDRCSPLGLVGPKRLHPPPVALSQLPAVDAIVISHDHYDHLDLPTVRRLRETQTAPFVVPLGVGAHLDRWGVPADRIIELDWHEHVDLAGLTVTATPARHFSGRGFVRDRTLWASWVVAGPTRRVFYSGDTGYTESYASIGAEYGPFDATLMQIGAYGPAWPDIHLTPEDAVSAHLDLNGNVLVPVHWGTFNLAVHGWAEPADRVWLEAKAHGIPLVVPRPGERVDVDDPPAVDGWWQPIACAL
ncbi:MAG: Zn-dependent hydrolase [Dactylosporangium sp.]|nr:MBL fold metallo-hydrolase [Dactylosporangium sp.]NNJ60498.1 Zn-dependent hydrolase [Dactylosporangium sp.]